MEGPGDGRPVVAVLEPLHPEAEALLGAVADLRRGLEAPLQGAAAVVTRGLGRVSAEAVREAGPALRCIARVGVGTDNIDLEAATAAGIPVLYAPEAFTAATAEHALALLLAVARGIPHMDRRVRNADWQARSGPLGLDLPGRRLGVVGLGRIGRRFAELGQALGMDVVAWSRSSRDARFPHLELDALLQDSDVVSLHLPLAPETAGFLGPDRIRRMRPGAILINVSRGALVDEEALAQALRSGALRGAGLDVLAREPPAPGHPLFDLPQVVLTPHSAALTETAFRRACLEVAGGVATCLRGLPLRPEALRNPTVLAARR
jgi:phosphoglycerate dehydrogenase-like enzyme